ncbi:DUF389 domain-containing protein [Streptomyces sp. HB2AG]|uniref:DUF389 domain-containing protein n=1 Tax=Streptomyces sp. HB2AG TaxID=2983400 RepID=UPI0022AA35A8|nr:DUF389 domain-containing protein [Streptomyces sp. HB2AG]MCZ2523898.1 DUF389 domain-containing protein [Streptomyces sp. HB2AG]
MLHLRLIVPADRTGEVCALLEGRPGTAHLVVLPGAARTPPGDVVMCDVARSVADGLLEGLRGLGVDERGAVTGDTLELVLSRSAREAEREAPGENADTVVWEAVVEGVRDKAALTPVFLVFMAVAVMLGACGVVLQSDTLIVGAMVVGPDFGPLAGLCVGLTGRDRRLARQSLATLAVGFPAAMLLTTLFSLLMRATGQFTAAESTAERTSTAFIWEPGHLALTVALLAGVAGMLSLTSSKSEALTGVAISVTTVPAAANTAVALAFGNLQQVGGSLLQLFVNVAGIVAAGTLTLGVGRRLLTRRRGHAWPHGD